MAARPPQVTIATALMCLFNCVGLFLYEPLEGVSAGTSRALWVWIYLQVAGIGFVVIWFFWRGWNWARWVVLAVSLVAVLSLGLPWPASVLGKATLVAEAILGAWLLFWLSTRAAKAFFRRRPEPGG